MAREELNAVLSGAFAMSGLFVASLGLYGLLAFIVAERAKEIGIRIALGVQIGRLLRSIMGAGLRLVAFGSLIGLLGAVALSRAMASLLFGVSSYDPMTRVVRSEPLVALRQE